MALPNIFTDSVTQQLIARIEKLTPETPPQWGKMSVSQMLAHCNVTYEMAFDNKHPKPNFLVATLLKLLVKNGVVNEVPYKPSLKTAPVFIIKDSRNFESEKNRLVQYMKKTVELGESYFVNKPSNSFGVLTSTEWNNMFYKHLDHHLKQFGV